MASGDGRATAAPSVRGRGSGRRLRLTFSHARQRSSPTQTVVRWTCIALLVLLVALPVAMLLYGSLRSAPPGLPAKLAPQNYAVLADPAVLDLIQNTVIIAAGSAVLAVLIGLTLAFLIVRTDVSGARVLDSAVVVPAYMSPFIGGLAWIMLLSPKIGYINQALTAAHLSTINIYSFGGIIWVIGLYYAPLAYLYIRPAMVNFDASLEECARVTGASQLTALRRVVLPLVTPAVLSAALVVSVQAAGQFGIPSVIGAPADIDVLPTAIVRRISQFPADPNTAAVLGLALTAITVVGLIVNNRVVRRADYVTASGRGVTHKRLALGRARHLWSAVCWGYVVLAVGLPVAAILVGSLQPYLSPTSFQLGWTIKNYAYVLGFPAVARSIVDSVVLAIAAAIIGTLLAALLSYFLVRSRRRTNFAIEQLASTPVAVPHTVFGLALLWTWVTIPVGIYQSKWVLLIAYVALFFPLAMRVTSPAFTQMAVELEEASRTLGGSWAVTVRRIVLPLLRPALVSAATIILYHSVRELSASILLYSTGNEVMAVAIYDLASEGRYGPVLALGMINVAITFAIVAVLNRLGRSLR